MNRSFLRSLTALFLTLTGLLVAREGPPIVDYSPKETIVEGNQPLATSYLLSVTAPNNVVAGTPLTITPTLSLLSKPANVTDSVALSYVTFTPAALTFSNPNETLTVRVDANFPLGIAAGAYAYQIFTAGWATGTQDGGAFINATVFPSQNATPPTVAISSPADQATFTYQPAVGPLAVPVRFTSTAQVTAPITTIDADVNGTALTVTSVNNGDGSFTSTGTLSLTAPGAYTVRARATNTAGTGEDTADFTVVVAVPAPTVAIATPAANASYTLSPAGTVAVPYSFSSNIAYGTIKTLTATLNGNPVSFTPAGLNTATATGTGTFNLTAAGTYTLAVSTTDSNGGTSSASTTFKVEGAKPPPTVTINAPANGTTLTRVVGSGPVSVSFKYTAKAATGFKISALVGTLSGRSGNLPATVTGLNTATAIGTGTLSLTTAGTYTLTATATSNGVTASASTTFTLVDVQPPPPTCSVNWLPPISLGQTVNDNSTLAIKFELDCDDDDDDCHHHRDCDGDHCDRDNDCDDRDHDHDRDCDRDDDGDRDSYPGQRTKSKTSIDKTVVIAISEIYSNGSSSPAQLFTYGDYSIRGNDMYQLNFRVPSGKRRFLVEVYRPTATGAEVLGSREFRSK